MCDLLAVASSHPFKASEAVPAFAILGQRNPDGWGLCYFDGGRPLVRRSARPAFRSGRMDLAMDRLAREAAGRVVLGHLRYATSGHLDSCNSHPFVLDILGQSWAFAHNGSCRAIESYRSRRPRVPNATSDSARTFEFLRDHLLDRWEKEGLAAFHLLGAIEAAILTLLARHPDGSFNFLLSNGSLLLAFSHWRPFWVLHRSKLQGDATLITTIREGLTDDEAWVQLGDEDRTGGLLLALSGDVIVHRRHLEVGM